MGVNHCGRWTTHVQRRFSLRSSPIVELTRLSRVSVLVNPTNKWSVILETLLVRRVTTKRTPLSNSLITKPSIVPVPVPLKLDTQGSPKSPLTTMASVQTVPFEWVMGDRLESELSNPIYLVLRSADGKLMTLKQAEIPRQDSDTESKRKAELAFESLRKEYALLSSLKHPSIIICYGAEQTAEAFNVWVIRHMRTYSNVVSDVSPIVSWNMFLVARSRAL